MYTRRSCLTRTVVPMLINQFAMTAYEWDLRFTLPTTNYKRALKTIKANIDNADMDSENVDFLMLSGIEFGKTGRDEDKTYHVHAGVVSSVPINGLAAKELFLRGTNVHHGSDVCVQSWCQRRDANKTYRGWFIHHTKSKMKIEGGYGIPLMCQWGDVPEDDHTQSNADKIMAVTREYDPINIDRERAIIQSWNANIAFKAYRLPRTAKERAEAKKEYLRLYRSNPDNKKRKRDQDQARKTEQYSAIRAEFEHMDKDHPRAPTLYCQLKHMEKLPYITNRIPDVDFD